MKPLYIYEAPPKPAILRVLKRLVTDSLPPSLLPLPRVQPGFLKGLHRASAPLSSSAMAGRLPDVLRSSQVSSSRPSISYLDPQLSVICVQPSQGHNWGGGAEQEGGKREEETKEQDKEVKEPDKWRIAELQML